MDADKETDADDYSAKTAMPALEKIQYAGAVRMKSSTTALNGGRADSTGLADGWKPTAPITSAPRFSVTTPLIPFASKTQRNP